MPALAEFGLGRRELALLTRRRTRIIYIVGDVDTGKTTLAACLARELARTGPTASVDLDAGQASIGLPTTFAWKRAGKRGKPDGMFFTGTTSPVGHFELAVAGAAAMVGEARVAADRVVVDTCGLARGELGAQLHQATADAIRPDVVVTVERADELVDLVAPFERCGRPWVIRASAAAAVDKRSWAARRSFRRAKLGAYFARGRELELDLDRIGVLRTKSNPAGRIASLRDGSGRDVALAIVMKHSPFRRTMAIWTPLSLRIRVRAVVLGAMRIARDGRQLARNV